MEVGELIRVRLLENDSEEAKQPQGLGVEEPVPEESAESEIPEENTPPEESSLSEDSPRSDESPPGANIEPIQETRKASFLIESVIVKTGSVVEVNLIQAGWSKNGRYYGEQVLREAMPLFEGAPIAVYGYEGDSERGHLDQSFRDFLPGFTNNIAGWSRNVREGVSSSGRWCLKADFHCAKPEIREMFVTAEQAFGESGPFPIGLSIDAQGTMRKGVAEGRSGWIVERIEHVYETTLVDRPAAGGEIVRLAAAEMRQQQNQEKGNKGMKKLRSFLSKFGSRIGVTAGRATLMQESEVMEKSVDLLTEMYGEDHKLVKLAMSFLSAGKTEEALEALGMLADETPPEPMEDPLIAATPEPVMEETLSEAKVELCETRLSRMLEDSKLPDKWQGSLRKRFSGRVFEKAELETAITEARELISESMPQAGPVQESVPRASIVHDAKDKFTQAVDLCFGFKPDKDSSLTESERAQYKAVGRVRSLKTLLENYEDQRLQEATTNDIPYHLNNSMNKVMRQEYRELPSYFDEVVEVDDTVDNFKSREIVHMGGFNTFPSRAEGTDYADLGFPGEYQSTFSVSTKGGIVPVTREMLKDDDLGRLRQIPRLLGRAARHQLNMFKGSFVTGYTSSGINTMTMFDGLALYHAAHGNLGISALAHATYVAADLKMDNQRDFGIKTVVNGSAIDDSSTTLPVAKTTGFQIGDFIMVESEEMLVTGVTAGTSLTVTRAQNSTTAAAHTAGKAVVQITNPIPVVKRHLWVPRELKATAYEVLYSDKKPGGQLNDINYANDQRDSGGVMLHVLHSAYLANDRNNWYLTADKSEVPIATVGFMDGNEEPELFYQDGDLVGSVFSKDVFTHKVRHEYGGVLTEYRGLQGNLVS